MTNEVDETRRSMVESSKNDQHAKADAGKVRLTLVPTDIIWAIGKVRMFGTNKYHGDPENWKSVSTERFKDAAFRHFLAYLEDETGVDADSGLPHLDHLACNIAFLIARRNEEARKNE